MKEAVCSDLKKAPPPAVAMLHLESLQVMEKNYMTMASEVEKLRAELKKQAEIDKRMAAAGPYAGFAGHNDKEASGHYPVGQNTYEDPYVAPQGWGQLPGGGAAADGNTAVGAQSGLTALRAGYGVYRGPGHAVPGYDMQRGSGFHKGPGAAPAYDPQRAPGAPAYDPQRGPGAPAYDPQRGPNPPGYDSHRGPGYYLYRGPGGTGYDRQIGPGGPGYEAHRGTSFESPTGPSGPKGSLCSKQVMLLMVLWQQPLMLAVVFREHRCNQHQHQHQQTVIIPVADELSSLLESELSCDFVSIRQLSDL